MTKLHKSIQKRIENPNSLYYGMPYHVAEDVRLHLKKHGEYESKGYHNLAKIHKIQAEKIIENHRRLKLLQPTSPKFDIERFEKIVVRFINDMQDATSIDIADAICDQYELNEATYNSILGLIKKHKVVKYSYTKAVFNAYR